MRNRSYFATLVLVFPALLAFPQAQPPAAAKPDYSQQAYVIEQLSTKVSLDNDGKQTREQVTRVRILTDAGVKAWGLLSFAYQSASETLDVDFVRVHKSDGSTIATHSDNVQDLDAEITRSAPFYSDIREKQVAVKGLGPGDVLEYQIHWHPVKALVPGQFWFQYNFVKQGIVLDERLEIRVPKERLVKVKGPLANATVSTDLSSRIYTWSYSNPRGTKDSDAEQTAIETVRGRLAAPDV
jgi:hypothetical protein